MEITKESVINLIKQDLKHKQLTSGLQNIRLDADLHTLEVIDIVAELMGIEKDKIGDQWADTYFSFLNQAHQLAVSEKAEELYPLAEECYNLLLACKNIEKRTQSDE